MQVGDLVMYMGHLGIILDSVIDTSNHWEVWFFDSKTYTVVYGSLMKKYNKNT